MLVPIKEIQINPGRREVEARDIEDLAKSIAQVGLLNPITITPDHTLIAGNHRLEAAKQLGWTEIECTIRDVSGLLAELAEIDENFVRVNLSPIEFGELLLRRKEIYEELHPETKHGGDKKSEEIKTTKCRFDSPKSFAEDTAEKLGVSTRTIERQIQTAKNLTPEAKRIIRNSDTDISKSDALKLPIQEKGPQIRVWQAALYIRLSVEFKGKRGDSLETQRQIMEAYIALCPDIEIAGIYTDNGTTGRTFERPAFQQMLHDVEAGKINCIVVKDLSRLGRNTIDTGYYIEKYFPLHGVRFISVNDQFDSENSENSGSHLIVPLKNMMNEMHVADISRKVRSQQRQAMQEGKFMGSRPP